MFGYVLFKDPIHATQAIQMGVVTYKDCKIKIKEYTPNAASQRNQP